jgi:hypothetical protein
MAAYRGTEEYQRLQGILRACKPDTILKQLQKAEQELPELYATFSMLSLLLYQEILSLDARRDDAGGESIMRGIEPVVIRATMRSPFWSLLKIDERALCQALERIAARNHFLGIANRRPAEPAHFCDEG